MTLPLTGDCVSCSESAELTDGYCAGCHAAIASAAQEMGVAFHMAAVKLNASRRTHSTSPDCGGPTKHGPATSDWGYHGERSFDT